MSACRSAFRIRIHRIVTHTDYIIQFDDGTYMILCVSYLMTRLAQMYLFSVTTIRFYAGGRYKLPNQCKPN